MTRGFAHSLVLLGLLAGPMARAAEPEGGGAPSVDPQPSEEEAPAQRRGSLAPGQTLVDGRVLVDEGWQVRWAPPEGWLALGADASDHVNPLAIGMLRNLTPLEGGALGSGGFLTALPDAVTEDRSPAETWMTRYPNADDVVMQEITHEGLDGWEIRFRLARHDSVQVHLVTVVPRDGHILAVQTFVPAGRSDLDALHAQSVEGLSFLDGEIVPPERGRTVLDVNRSGFRVQDGWFEHPGLGVRMRVPAPWSLMLPGALRAAGHDSVVGAISRSQRVNFFLTLSGEEDPEGFLARLRTVVESRDGMVVRSETWTLPGLTGPLDALVVEHAEGQLEVDAMECVDGSCVLHQLIGPTDAVESEGRGWAPELERMSEEQRDGVRAALASAPLDIRAASDDWTAVGRVIWSYSGGYRLRVPDPDMELLLGTEANRYGAAFDLVLLDRERSLAWALVRGQDPSLGWKDVHAASLSAVWARSDLEVDKRKVAGRKVLTTPIIDAEGQHFATAATVRLDDGAAHFLHVHGGAAPDLAVVVGALRDARRASPGGLTRTSDVSWVDAAGGIMLRGAGVEVERSPGDDSMADLYRVTVGGSEPQAMAVLRLPDGSRDMRQIARAALAGAAQPGNEIRQVEDGCPEGAACWETEVAGEGVVRFIGHGRVFVSTTGLVADRLHLLTEDELEAFAATD